MRELAVQAANGSNDSNDIANLNKEFASLATEIDRVTDNTEFNGLKVLQGNLTNDQLDFVVGKDVTDKMTVSFSDFNLTDGAAIVSETLGSEDFARAQGNGSALAGDLAGTIFLSDGTTSISITLDDVKTTNNNAALVASTATHIQVAAALNAKANASTAFKLNIAADGTSGFTFTEKAGQGHSMNGVTPIYTGTDANNLTFAGSVAGTTGGVMGVDLSAYKSTASGSLKNVDTSTTVAEIDVAIKGVAQARADFGAVINTLEHSIDNLNVAIQNTAAARSAIMDADYAVETTELARTQILAQAATAMLSQANQQQQSVLALLK
jgi:flagellin